MSKSPVLGSIRKHLPAIVGFGLPFALIVFLAIEAGGYDLVVRSQLGIVIWWTVLFGAAAGLLPVGRVTRAGWIGIAVLASLMLWTALGALTWTQSTERSVTELGRVSMLLGVFLLLMLMQRKGDSRRFIAAAGAAAAVIAVVALASRFHPGWFPTSDIPKDFPISRISYPLEYWNGLATLMAMGLASLTWMAASARSRYLSALAAASIPLLVLTCFMTASRGGAIEVAAALLVLVVLFPRRLHLCLNLVVPVAGSVLLLWLIEQRPELRDNAGGVAGSQGTEMIWLTLAVFIVTFALALLVAVAVERRKVIVPEVSRRITSAFGITVASLAGLLIVVLFASGYAGDRWGEFKQPAVTDSTVGRLASVNSGERYEQWQSALDASASERLTGIGPGAYEFWWSRSGNGVGFVRDAHSLYLEGLAEMGPVGFLLVLALILVPIGFATVGAVRNPSTERRAQMAAAAGGMVAFAVAAGIDWAWEMTVLPVVFLVLAAAALGPDAETRTGRRHAPGFRTPFTVGQRVAVAAFSLVAIAAIAVPLAGTQLVRESQSLYRQGDTAASLDKAEQATRVQPYSSTARIQLALLQASEGDGQAALDSARQATRDDSLNWRAWLVLSQIARQQGLDRVADAAGTRVAQLNHRSTIQQ